MRTLITFEARQSFAYDNTVNHQLQGRLYTALRRADAGQILDVEGPRRFSYSNIFPPRDAEEGDIRRLIFACVDDDAVEAVAEELQKDPIVSLGTMMLRTKDAQFLSPDVGDRGELTTGTPIIVRLDQDDAHDRDPERGAEYEDNVYWRPEHGADVFFDSIYDILQRQFRYIYGEEPPDPPYFNGYEVEDVISKPVDFGDSDPIFIGTEWTFEYRVRDRAHKRMLNLILDVGLGEITGLGFGFINPGDV